MRGVMRCGQVVQRDGSGMGTGQRLVGMGGGRIGRKLNPISQGCAGVQEIWDQLWGGGGQECKTKMGL